MGRRIFAIRSSTFLSGLSWEFWSSLSEMQDELWISFANHIHRYLQMLSIILMEKGLDYFLTWRCWIVKVIKFTLKLRHLQQRSSESEIKYRFHTLIFNEFEEKWMVVLKRHCELLLSALRIFGFLLPRRFLCDLFLISSPFCQIINLPTLLKEPRVKI